MCVSRKYKIILQMFLAWNTANWVTNIDKYEKNISNVDSEVKNRSKKLWKNLNMIVSSLKRNQLMTSNNNNNHKSAKMSKSSSSSKSGTDFSIAAIMGRNEEPDSECISSECFWSPKKWCYVLCRDFFLSFFRITSNIIIMPPPPPDHLLCY